MASDSPLNRATDDPDRSASIVRPSSGYMPENATAFLTENPDLVQSILARIQADAGPEQIVSARLLPTTDQPGAEVTPVVEEVPAEV